VECPRCGDVHIVRISAVISAAGAGRQDDPAAVAGYPPKNGPEVDVLTLRSAMIRANPLLFFLLALGLVGGGVAGIITLFFAPPMALIGGGIFVASLIALGIWKLFSLHDRLIITTRRITDREGLLSKRTSEIMYKDIRNVVVNQSFFDRLLNVGTIAISTSASENGLEIYMEHLAKPHEIKKVIDLYR